MKVVEIYRKYEIPDHLALHMLRVSALAKIVLDQFDNLDDKNILQTCLLHDLGNIVKFTDIRSSDWAKEKGPAYWLGVQKRFWEKYGYNDHETNIKILNELGVDSRIKELSEALSFEPEVFARVADGDDFEMKIVLYGDSRISPQGIVPVEERMADLERRYVGVERMRKLSREVFEATKKPVFKVARQIEAIAGEDMLKITNADLEGYFEELLEYDIPVNGSTMF